MEYNFLNDAVQNLQRYFFTFLGDMQCVAFFSHRRLVHVCVHVSRWWTGGEQIEINPPFFHFLVCHKNPFNDIFGDVVAHDLDLLFEDQSFESRPFW